MREDGRQQHRGQDPRGKLIGYNTDGVGFYTSLVEEGKINVEESTFFCFGAGGAGRAMCSVLAYHGAKKIYITDFYEPCAESLVMDINENFAPVAELVHHGDYAKIAECNVVMNASGIGMGSTIGTAAMQACIRRAKEHGVSFCTANHASHYGFGGFYAMQAAAEGMIGFNICNSPALVAPFGGATAMLGTNPLTVAVPSGKYPDLVLDMATSTVAKGKIALALKEGKSIPDNWAWLRTAAPPQTPL